MKNPKLFARVYLDPITQQKLEGIARLEKRTYQDDETERWIVRFTSVKHGGFEEETFERTFSRPIFTRQTYEELL